MQTKVQKHTLRAASTEKEPWWVDTQSITPPTQTLQTHTASNSNMVFPWYHLLVLWTMAPGEVTSYHPTPPPPVHNVQCIMELHSTTLSSGGDVPLIPHQLQQDSGHWWGGPTSNFLPPPPPPPPQLWRHITMSIPWCCTQPLHHSVASSHSSTTRFNTRQCWPLVQFSPPPPLWRHVTASIPWCCTQPFTIWWWCPTHPPGSTSRQLWPLVTWMYVKSSPQPPHNDIHTIVLHPTTSPSPSGGDIPLIHHQVQPQVRWNHVKIPAPSKACNDVIINVPWCCWWCCTQPRSAGRPSAWSRHFLCCQRPWTLLQQLVSLVAWAEGWVPQWWWLPSSLWWWLLLSLWWWLPSSLWWWLPLSSYQQHSPQLWIMRQERTVMMQPPTHLSRE